MVAYDIYEVGETFIHLNALDKHVNWIHDVLKHARYEEKKRNQTMGFA